MKTMIQNIVISKSLFHKGSKGKLAKRGGGKTSELPCNKPLCNDLHGVITLQWVCGAIQCTNYTCVYPVWHYPCYTYLSSTTPCIATYLFYLHHAWPDSQWRSQPSLSGGTKWKKTFPIYLFPDVFPSFPDLFPNFFPSFSLYFLIFGNFFAVRRALCLPASHWLCYCRFTFDPLWKSFIGEWIIFT